MAWTAPMTAVDGNALNAADFNTYVRDNLNETAPSVAATEGAWFCSDAANNLVQRLPGRDYIATAQTTTSTSYTNLATTGPTVTLTTGTKAIVNLFAGATNSNANSASAMSFAVSGATTIAASDAIGIAWDGIDDDADGGVDEVRKGVSVAVTLTAGSNTFTAKYLAGSGTSTFQYRRLSVWCF